jgi:hypothetical protein
MGSIDRIDWHSGGDFPENLPEVNGGTHIGMYLTWIIQNDLIGQLHLEDSTEAIQKVKSRQMTGRDFLIDFCDEKFSDEDLNEEGIKFTDFYYQTDSNEKFKNYMDNYCDVIGEEVDSIYEVEDNWENYDKLKPLIDKRYAEWKKSGQ